MKYLRLVAPEIVRVFDSSKAFKAKRASLPHTAFLYFKKATLLFEIVLEFF